MKSNNYYSLEEIKTMLDDNNLYYKVNGISLCKGINDITVEEWMNQWKWQYREDVTFEMIESLLLHQNKHIARCAYKVCFHNKLPIPLIRTIEPNEKVYKKCLDKRRRYNVIVEVEIPSNAQVRGKIDGKCRASEAIITDIIGGEVGISYYDNDVKYRVGDHVIIDDFDYSDEECSTGFSLLQYIKGSTKL